MLQQCWCFQQKTGKSICSQLLQSKITAGLNAAPITATGDFLFDTCGILKQIPSHCCTFWSNTSVMYLLLSRVFIWLKCPPFAPQCGLFLVNQNRFHFFLRLSDHVVQRSVWYTVIRSLDSHSSLHGLVHLYMYRAASIFQILAGPRVFLTVTAATASSCS